MVVNPDTFYLNVGLGLFKSYNIIISEVQIPALQLLELGPVNDVYDPEMLPNLLFRGPMLSNFKTRAKESRKHHQLQPVQKPGQLSHLKDQQGSVGVLWGCVSRKGGRRIMVEMIRDGQQLRLRHHLSLI